MTLYIIIGFIWFGVLLDIYVLCKTSNKGRLYVTDEDELFLHLDIPVEEVRNKKFLKLAVKQINSNPKSHK